MVAAFPIGHTIVVGNLWDPGEKHIHGHRIENVEVELIYKCAGRPDHTEKVKHSKYRLDDGTEFMDYERKDWGFFYGYHAPGEIAVMPECCKQAVRDAYVRDGLPIDPAYCDGKSNAPAVTGKFGVLVEYMKKGKIDFEWWSRFVDMQEAYDVFDRKYAEGERVFLVQMQNADVHTCATTCACVQKILIASQERPPRERP